MNQRRTLYIVVVSLIAFFVWAAGMVFIIMNDLSMTIARIWAIFMFVAACTWSIVHFRRKEKKAEEDEANENYKSLY